MTLENSQFDALLASVLRDEPNSLSAWHDAKDRISSAQIQTTLQHVQAALAANANNAAALTLTAYMHHNGQGGAVNYPEAIRLYEQAIALGNASAMYNCAVMHHNRQGGAINYPEAIRLYEQAIALGHATAMNNRAVMHHNGQGGAVNDPEAIRLYEQAIALGHATAMYHRALMHRKGQGGAVNDPEAIRLYEQAIALGDADAMNNRAVMHQEGQGGAINHPEAIRLFEQAIALGHAAAMHNRALMHREGQGAPQNLDLAGALYYQAYKAESPYKPLQELVSLVKATSCPMAAYYLVLIYLTGNETDRDLTQAKHYVKQQPEKISALLYRKLLELVDAADAPDADADVTASLPLLKAFLPELPPKCISGKLLKLVQLKLLLWDELFEEALIFYDKYIAATDDLTPNNLFQLANAQFSRLGALTEKQAKLNCISKACTLLYPAHKTQDKEASRLLIHFLREEQRIVNATANASLLIDDQSAQTDQRLLTEFEEGFYQYSKQLVLAEERGAIKLFLSQLETQNASWLPSFFVAENQHKEMALARTLLSYNESGQLFAEMLTAHPEQAAEWAKYPRLQQAIMTFVPQMALPSEDTAPAQLNRV